MVDIHTSYAEEENKLNNTDFVIANTKITHFKASAITVSFTLLQTHFHFLIKVLKLPSLEPHVSMPNEGTISTVSYHTKRITPKLQQSTARLYPAVPSEFRTSGARYVGVPHNVFMREVSPRILDCPKSVILYLKMVTPHYLLGFIRLEHITLSIYIKG